MHRTNIPAQFLSSAAELAIAHGTPALPLLSQSAPKPPLMAGARLPCRCRHPRLVARPAPSAPARWPRAASAETAAQLLGGRSEWVQPPGTGIQLPVAPTALQRPTGRSQPLERTSIGLAPSPRPAPLAGRRHGCPGPVFAGFTLMLNQAGNPRKAGERAAQEAALEGIGQVGSRLRCRSAEGHTRIK